MQQASTRPARPGTGLTEDGRRLAEVVTYSRRSSGLDPKLGAAWRRHAGDWWIPDDAADSAGFDLDRWFGRSSPLVVEIGSGVGEATAALAAQRPESNILAFEVWQPGIAQTFRRLEEVGASNVRLMSIDAVWSFEHLLSPGSVSEIWTFFPDPWPKRRHHRRRLVGAGFASLAASRLLPGGGWRLATDWAPYAAQMGEVLSGEPLLENVYDREAPRWSARPLTRFERRGIADGRSITDLTYRRTG